MFISEENYIFGIPVETELGKINYLKTKEFKDYNAHLSALSLSVDKMLYQYYISNRRDKQKHKELKEPKI